MMLGLLKKYCYLIILIAILIFAFVLRIKIYLDNPSFWFDEAALGFNITTLNFKELFGVLHLQQVAPPFFLIISKIIIKLFGLSDLNLRLFPFLIGNLSIIAFYLVLNKYLKNKLAILFGLIAFCFNIQILNFTVEFKPYILEVFSMCVILYTFAKLNLNWSYKKLLGVGVVLSILPYFAFISIILLSLIYLINFSKNNIKKWLVFVAPSIISFLAFVIYYININSFYKDFMLDCWEKAFMTPQTFWLFLKELFVYTMSIKLFLISIIFFVVGYIICWLKYRKIAIFTTLILSILITLSFLKQYIFYERFILFLIPLMILISVLPLEYISSKRKLLSVIIIFFSLFLFIFPSYRVANAMFVHKFSKDSCARELMQYMMENKKDTDKIFVDNMSINEFLYYSKYYKFNNKVILDAIYKNNIIMYSISKNNIFNEKNNTWIYSSYSKIDKKSLIYTYDKKYNCSIGETLYVTGRK